MGTNHIQPFGTFKIRKRDKECVLGIYRYILWCKKYLETKKEKKLQKHIKYPCFSYCN